MHVSNAWNTYVKYMYIFTCIRKTYIHTVVTAKLGYLKTVQMVKYANLIYVLMVRMFLQSNSTWHKSTGLLI